MECVNLEVLCYRDLEEGIFKGMKVPRLERDRGGRDKGANPSRDAKLRGFGVGSELGDRGREVQASYRAGALARRSRSASSRTKLAAPDQRGRPAR